MDSKEAKGRVRGAKNSRSSQPPEAHFVTPPFVPPCDREVGSLHSGGPLLGALWRATGAMFVALGMIDRNYHK